MRIILFIFIFCLATGLCAQVPFIDSLEVALANASEDREKIKFSIELAYALRANEPVKALEEEEETILNQAPILYKIGRNLMSQGNYESALPYFWRSLNFYQGVEVEKELPFLFYHIGKNYANLHQWDSAALRLDEALDLSKQFKFKNIQISSLIELGRVNWNQGQATKARAHLEDAFRLATAADLVREKALAAEVLYDIYKEQNQVTIAQYYQKIHQQIRDSLVRAENADRLIRLETDHAFEKALQRQAHEQEKAALLSQEQLKRERTIEIATAIALMVTLVGIGIIARYYQLKRQAHKKLKQLNEKISGQKNILEKQKEKLEELDKMKSHFFTNISHEFRTPLTVIDGMVHQMKNAPEEWSEKGLRMIERNNANLLHLVNQILDLRKLESGKLQLNLVLDDVTYYLKYIIEPFQSFAENRNIKLHFLCDEKELMMDYDKEKLLQIVSNLLSNAIKFTPVGGNIYLLIKKEQSTYKEQVDRPAVTDEQLLIQVRDTGIGIPEEKIPHIFARFYQVENWLSHENEGTGIGLALTQELVKLMKGTISVKSEYKRGTTFTISLPITRKAKIQKVACLPVSPTGSIGLWEDDPPDLAQRSASDSQLLSLLIIEDNPDVVQYLQWLLKDHYQLYIARDGQEGIETALDKTPALVVCDLKMPHKDGYEVCDTLKKDERTSHIPIVLLTAKGDDESHVAGFKHGADAYLAKPFNREELFVRLEKLHELRLALQARYSSLEPTEPGQYPIEDAFILKVRSIVEDHLSDEKFGVPELCRAIGMSRSQLHLKIKALTNRSTSHNIRAIRLYKAKELLKTSDLNITQVAYEVGFNDPAYFTRSFSEEFGIAPRDFKR